MAVTSHFEPAWDGCPLGWQQVKTWLSWLAGGVGARLLSSPPAPAAPFCGLPEMHGVWGGLFFGFGLFFSSRSHGKRMFRSERKLDRCFLGSACSKQPFKITRVS